MKIAKRRKHKTQLAEPMTRRQMALLMDTIRDQIVGIPRKKEELSQIVGELLSVHLNADVMQSEAKEVDLGDMNMNACYDPELDSMARPCIEITLVYNPLESMIIFDDEGFGNLTRRLADALAHEQIHKYQHRERFWDSWPVDYEDDEDDIIVAQKYLGHKDEIDAYSHNIANELLDYTDYQNVLTLLAKPTIIKLEQSVNLWVYVNTFGRDATHPVIKRLLKKIIKRLPDLNSQR